MRMAAFSAPVRDAVIFADAHVLAALRSVVLVHPAADDGDRLLGMLLDDLADLLDARGGDAASTWPMSIISPVAGGELRRATAVPAGAPAQRRAVRQRRAAAARARHGAAADGSCAVSRQRPNIGRTTSSRIEEADRAR